MEGSVGECLPPSVSEKGGGAPDEPQDLQTPAKLSKITPPVLSNGHRLPSTGRQVDDEEEEEEDEEEEEEEVRRAAEEEEAAGGVEEEEEEVEEEEEEVEEEEEEMEEEEEEEEEEDEEEPTQQQQQQQLPPSSQHQQQQQSHPGPPLPPSSAPSAGSVSMGSVSGGGPTPQAVIPCSDANVNGHNSHELSTHGPSAHGHHDAAEAAKQSSVYDFDASMDNRAPAALPPPQPPSQAPSHHQHQQPPHPQPQHQLPQHHPPQHHQNMMSHPGMPPMPDRRPCSSADGSDSSIKRETLDDSEMAEDSSVVESYDGDDCYPMDDPCPIVEPTMTVFPRRGRGRPRGSKNRTDGRGRGRGIKFRRLSEDRTCTAYDLRNIPDPFANQRRGRPRSRFIVDLGEQNHEAWCKNKEELNISDAELTTLLLSLLESRRDCSNAADSDAMLGLIGAEYSKWKEKFSSQVSLLSHYSSIHNTNCCTCLGIKKKKYVPAGTGKRGRPRKYPPPVGYGPGMQRPDTIDEDGNIFEPQIILKDGMVVKNEPTEDAKGLRPAEGGPPGHEGPHAPNTSTDPADLLPRPILTKEELEKRREYYNNHKNKVKYVCHYCQVHFYHKPNFDFHISKLESLGKCRIFDKVNNLYLCESCGEGFSWREKLEKHLRLAEQHGTHNQKELLMFGDFQCNVCGKTFNKRTTYLQHMKWHEDREDIPCVICGNMFKQVDLRHHLMEAHSNDSLPCCYCGKLFASRKYLEKHELVHQAGNFPCPECGKCFTQKSNMQQHLKNHSDPGVDRDYACDHCGQLFSSDYNLKLHKRKVHNLHVDGLAPEDMVDHHHHHHHHADYLSVEDVRERAYGATNSAVKNMLGVSLGSTLGSTLGSSLGSTLGSSLGSTLGGIGSAGLSLSAMKQEGTGAGGGGGEPMEDSGVQLHMRETSGHMADMRRAAEGPDGMDPEDHHQIRMAQHHASGGMGSVNEDSALHMPQDLTRMAAAHMSDESGRMSAAPAHSQHLNDIRNDIRNSSVDEDSPGRITDTPAHMTADNLGRMAAENFGRMTGTPGGYLAEHLRRMAENQSRMSDSVSSHYDERDNYGRLGDNLRSMSRGGGSADPMARVTDNLSHMGVIRPTQTPSSTPQWPPHMQNHAAAALDGMNQSTQGQHALYPLPFWPYDPSLRQYHH